MVSDVLLRQVVDDSVLPAAVAQEYLSIYLAPADWISQLQSMWERTRRTGMSDEECRNDIRNSVAFVALLPTHRRDVDIDRQNPESLFHRASRWRECRERDWFSDLQKVIRRDLDILGWRGRLAALGHVDPLQYAPYCRQAYNWLYERANQDKWVTPDTKAEVVEWCENLVHLYGGVCISNIFLRHEDVVDRVVNWRTGYHFERRIFEIYTLEQAEKIKTAELQKTNPTLVKSLTVAAVQHPADVF